MFNNTATLRFKDPFRKAHVINIKYLIPTLISEHSEINLEQGLILLIKNKLSKLEITDKKGRQIISEEHVKHIKSKLQKDKENGLSNLCPKCGSSLKLRKGKYRTFKGCSFFPKCRYTAS
ncbi:topoisomerase DNA-binding C4 zinc finger domain-containing protein [Metabacillus idriensis]|uniref:topoisomerase DNA-binding C4 zinc finger domain-containing protein n=1 Tax=Metabacillus idriensis TaxID=324768 RepID=UPI00174EA27B|nr:topoisomerase DNA-binding C4 zinc finger domain-containing protein [Metabacillus idriensis]